MKEKDEAELVMLLQEKSSRAFNRLYSTYAGALHRTVLKLTQCPVAAQDIVQNAFVKIWANSEKYDTAKGRLFTWMFNITRNETFDYLRSKHYRQGLVSGGKLSDTVPDGIGADRLITRMDLKRVLVHLPCQERAIMDMALSGFTCKEIGKLFGMPEGSVKTKMRTSYKKLRKAFPA